MYFLFLLMLLISDHYHLDVVDFNNLQDLELEEFEQQAGEGYFLSLSLVYTIAWMH
jgi:hypothetical protein